MRLTFLNLLATPLLALVAAAPPPTPLGAQAIYESTAKSLVVVQYTWDFELGHRQVRTCGIIVDRAGIVMVSAAAFDDRIPEAQIKDVQILVPRHGADPEIIPADYLGRSDRTHLAFVKAHTAVDWSALSFSSDPVEVGEPFYSVGLVKEGANGFKPLLMQGLVSAVIPEERTQVLADGSLAGVGSPVLDQFGHAIGFVDAQPSATQHSREGESNDAPPPTPPPMFTPSSDFVDSLAHLGKPEAAPWLGVFDMTGLSQDASTYYGLSGPAVQVSSVAASSPAEGAGIAQGDIITAIDGHPFESGDTSEQIPDLFRRQLIRCSPGQTITLTVIKQRGKPAIQVSIKLGSEPPRPNAMPRYWAEKMGFGVRDICFIDRYAQHIPETDRGVIVAVVKPDGPAAAAHTPMNGLLLNVNGKPVSDVEDFQREYNQILSNNPNEALLLLVREKGHEETLRVEPAR